MNCLPTAHQYWKPAVDSFDPCCNNSIVKARGIQYTVAEAGNISALQGKLRQWNRDQHRLLTNIDD